MFLNEKMISNYKNKAAALKEELKTVNGKIEKCKTLPPETLYYDPVSGRRGKYGKAYHALLAEKEKAEKEKAEVKQNFLRTAICFFLSVLTGGMYFLPEDTVDRQAFTSNVICLMDGHKDAKNAMKLLLSEGPDAAAAALMDSTLAYDIKNRLYAPYWYSKVRSVNGGYQTPLLGETAWTWDSEVHAWAGHEEYQGKDLISFNFDALPPTKELMAAA